MADREKVIKGLDSCGSDIADLDKGCETCPYYEFSGHTEHDFDFNCIRMLSRDALDLLKSQLQIVRCKDCKWFIKKFENEGRCIKHDNDYHDPDWYCADGKRKE